jgi:hypothetical protein
LYRGVAPRIGLGTSSVLSVDPELTYRRLADSLHGYVFSPFSRERHLADETVSFADYVKAAIGTGKKI